jgi:hypothetical protein
MESIFSLLTVKLIRGIEWVEYPVENERERE